MGIFLLFQTSRRAEHVAVCSSGYVPLSSHIFPADFSGFFWMFLIKCLFQSCRENCHRRSRSVFTDPFLHPRRRRQHQIALVRKPSHKFGNHYILPQLQKLLLQDPPLSLGLQKSDIMQIIFISRMIGVDHRKLIFPPQI